jgi:hypothetical protein
MLIGGSAPNSISLANNAGRVGEIRRASRLSRFVGRVSTCRLPSGCEVRRVETRPTKGESGLQIAGSPEWTRQHIMPPARYAKAAPAPDSGAGANIKNCGFPVLRIAYFRQTEDLNDLRASFNCCSISAVSSFFCAMPLRTCEADASIYCKTAIWNSCTRFTGTSSR